MQPVQLFRAGPMDIPAIRGLATLVWNQHYPAIISKEQIEYMLNRMYSEESLDEQMRKGHQFYLIAAEEKNIGFMSVHNIKGDEWFINKFYIDQEKASKGAGSEAFRLLLNLIRPKTIGLTVNRHNVKAINFYFKNGFIIEKTADFDIGNGFVMNDFVMKWKE